MASKNVALRMSVVRRLDLIRKPGESYSDVIDRIIPDRITLAELANFIRRNPETGPDDLTPRVLEIRRLLNQPRRGSR